MAYAFETGGYGFAPALVPVDQQALQGLKPLSFAGGGQSPVQFKPLAGWSVPSSHPELIAQGISSGLGSIAQGIEAAYKSKEAKAEKQKDREYELQKYDQQRKTKLEDEETLARFRASLPSRYATKSESIPPDYDSEETGDYGTSAMSSTPSPAPAEAPTPRAERYKRDISPIKGGSFNEINLPEEDENSVPARLRNLKNSLGDITSPVPISEAPSPRGQDAVNALSSIDWSKVQGSLGAGTGAGASPVDIPAQAPDWLRKPKAVTAPLSTLGGVSDESLPNVEQALADAQTAYASGTIHPSESLKSAGGVPKAAFKSYSEAQRYIDSQSDNPNWYAEGAPKPDKFGNFVIPWKHHDPAAMAMRQESQETRKETAKSTKELRTQNTLNREAAMFQSHSAVQAFTAVNGMQQSFPKFVKDYDAIIKNPEAAGISDVGLLDMFARAEGGGRVTEGQANLVLGSMGIMDKAKLLGMRLEGGDRLSQNQRDQMLRVIAEDHDAQVKIANQAVQMTRAKLIKQGITDEDSLPQPYIAPKTKSQAMEEITNLKKQAIQLNEQRKREFASGNKATADKLKNQIEEIGKNAVEIRKQIDNSSSSIINLHELENTPQGWTGGAVTTLLQQQ